MQICLIPTYCTLRLEGLTYTLIPSCLQDSEYCLCKSAALDVYSFSFLTHSCKAEKFVKKNKCLPPNNNKEIKSPLKVIRTCQNLQPINHHCCAGLPLYSIDLIRQ